MKKVLVLNGPNLGRLGQREKSYYGDLDYDELRSFIEESALSVGLDVDVRQSDEESTLIKWVHEAVDHDLPDFQPSRFHPLLGGTPRCLCHDAQPFNRGTSL